MNKITQLTTFALLTCLAPMTVGAQARLTLIDSIAVEAPVVHLADIASIETDDEALRQRLAKLPVGEAPSITGTRLISSYRIRATLEKERISDVEIDGAQTVVSTAVKEMSREELQSLVDGWVQGQLSEQQDAEVEYVSLPKYWKLPAGEKVDVSIKYTGKQLVGPVTVNIQAVADGKVYASTRVCMNVDLYQEAVVMVRPVKRGQQLQAEHVERRRSKVTRASGMEVVDASSIIGLVAKKDLRVGYRPNVRDFSLPIDIKRGSSNRIIVMNGDLRLQVAGAVALQDGRRGESIIFSNPMNQGEPLRAEVVRPGLAKIKMN